MANVQQFSLRWNNYLSHITDAFESLRADEDLVDVTLSCEGKKIKAHKMLLSACSSYFKEIFKDNPCQHPVIIFRNVKYDDLEALVSFMYQGEVSIVQERLSSFLNTAELLEIKGLTGGSSGPSSGTPEEKIDESSEDVISTESIQTRKQPIGRKKASSPVPSQLDVSPPPLKKKRKHSTGETESKQDDDNVQHLKIKQEYYDNDSPEPYEDPNSCSEGLPNYSNDQNFGVTPSDDSGEGLASYDRGAGTSNDGSLHDSLQVEVGESALYTCQVCGKTFRHSGSLSMHRRLHSGDTHCPFCGKIFSRTYYLRIHIQMHHSWRPLPDVSRNNLSPRQEDGS